MIIARKGSGISKIISDDDEEIEEFRRHIELIIDECKEIKNACT
jgi:hypothetical protein